MEQNPFPERVPDYERFRQLETHLDTGMTTDLKALDMYLELGAKVHREIAVRYGGEYHEEFARISLSYYRASQGTYRKEKKKFCAVKSSNYSAMEYLYRRKGNLEFAEDCSKKADNWRRLAVICEQTPENSTS